MNPNTEKKKRNKAILDLRDAGWSFGAIAAKLNLRKQTVHEIYNRDKEKAGADKFQGWGVNKRSNFYPQSEAKKA